MKRGKKILFVILAVIAVIVINGVYYVFAGQGRSMRKLESGKELNLYECCSIYTMHMAVWMFGWPLAPEAAHEAFLLHFPHKKDVVRNIDMYAANGFSKEIQVKGVDYANMKWADMRVPLALNSPDTYFEVTDSYSMCVVPVAYTDAVHRIGRIPVNTSLFVYLQKRGLLHPYRMVYYYMYV